MDFLPTKKTNPSSISVTHPLNYANEPKCVHRLRVKQVPVFFLIHFRGKCALYRVKVCHIRTSLKNIL